MNTTMPTRLLLFLSCLLLLLLTLSSSSSPSAAAGGGSSFSFIVGANAQVTATYTGITYPAQEIISDPIDVEFISCIFNAGLKFDTGAVQIVRRIVVRDSTFAAIDVAILVDKVFFQTGSTIEFKNNIFNGATKTAADMTDTDMIGTSFLFSGNTVASTAVAGIDMAMVKFQRATWPTDISSSSVVIDNNVWSPQGAVTIDLFKLLTLNSFTTMTVDITRNTLTCNANVDTAHIVNVAMGLTAVGFNVNNNTFNPMQVVSKAMIFNFQYAPLDNVPITLNGNDIDMSGAVSCDIVRVSQDDIFGLVANSFSSPGSIVTLQENTIVMVSIKSHVIISTGVTSDATFDIGRNDITITATTALSKGALVMIGDAAGANMVRTALKVINNNVIINELSAVNFYMIRLPTVILQAAEVYESLLLVHNNSLKIRMQTGPTAGQKFAFVGDFNQNSVVTFSDNIIEHLAVGNRAQYTFFFNFIDSFATFSGNNVRTVLKNWPSGGSSVHVCTMYSDTVRNSVITMENEDWTLDDFNKIASIADPFYARNWEIGVNLVNTTWVMSDSKFYVYGSYPIHFRYTGGSPIVNVASDLVLNVSGSHFILGKTSTFGIANYITINGGIATVATNLHVVIEDSIFEHEEYTTVSGGQTRSLSFPVCNDCSFHFARNNFTNLGGLFYAAELNALGGNSITTFDSNVAWHWGSDFSLIQVINSFSGSAKIISYNDTVYAHNGFVGMATVVHVWVPLMTDSTTVYIKGAVHTCRCDVFACFPVPQAVITGGSVTIEDSYFDLESGGPQLLAGALNAIPDASTGPITWLLSGVELRGRVLDPFTAGMSVMAVMYTFGGDSAVGAPTITLQDTYIDGDHTTAPFGIGPINQWLATGHMKSLTLDNVTFIAKGAQVLVAIQPTTTSFPLVLDIQRSTFVMDSGQGCADGSACNFVEVITTLGLAAGSTVNWNLHLLNNTMYLKTDWIAINAFVFSGQRAWPVNIEKNLDPLSVFNFTGNYFSVASVGSRLISFGGPTVTGLQLFLVENEIRITDPCRVCWGQMIEFLQGCTTVTIQFYDNIVYGRGSIDKSMFEWTQAVTDLNFHARGNTIDILAGIWSSAYNFCKGTIPVSGSTILIEDEVIVISANSNGGSPQHIAAPFCFHAQGGGAVSTHIVRNSVVSIPCNTVLDCVALGIFAPRCDGSVLVENVSMIIQATGVAAFIGIDTPAGGVIGTTTPVDLNVTNCNVVATSTLGSVSGLADQMIGTYGALNAHITGSSFDLSSDTSDVHFTKLRADTLTVIDNSITASGIKTTGGGTIVGNIETTFHHGNYFNISAIDVTNGIACLLFDLPVLGGNHTFTENTCHVNIDKDDPPGLVGGIVAQHSTAYPIAFSTLTIANNIFYTNGTAIVLGNGVTNDVFESSILVQDNQAYLTLNTTFFRADGIITDSNMSFIDNYIFSPGAWQDAWWLVNGPNTFVAPNSPNATLHMHCNFVNRNAFSKFQFAVANLQMDLCATPSRSFTQRLTLTETAKTPTLKASASTTQLLTSSNSLLLTSSVSLPMTASQSVTKASKSASIPGVHVYVTPPVGNAITITPVVTGTSNPATNPVTGGGGGGTPSPTPSPPTTLGSSPPLGNGDVVTVQVPVTVTTTGMSGPVDGNLTVVVTSPNPCCILILDPFAPPLPTGGSGGSGSSGAGGGAGGNSPFSPSVNYTYTNLTSPGTITITITIVIIINVDTSSASTGGTSFTYPGNTATFPVTVTASGPDIYTVDGPGTSFSFGVPVFDLNSGGGGGAAVPNITSFYALNPNATNKDNATQEALSALNPILGGGLNNLPAPPFDTVTLVVGHNLNLLPSVSYAGPFPIFVTPVNSTHAWLFSFNASKEMDFPRPNITNTTTDPASINSGYSHSNNQNFGSFMFNFQSWLRHHTYDRFTSNPNMPGAQALRAWYYTSMSRFVAFRNRVVPDLFYCVAFAAANNRKESGTTSASTSANVTTSLSLNDFLWVLRGDSNCSAFGPPQVDILDTSTSGSSQPASVENGVPSSVVIHLTRPVQPNRDLVEIIAAMGATIRVNRSSSGIHVRRHWDNATAFTSTSSAIIINGNPVGQYSFRLVYVRYMYTMSGSVLLSPNDNANANKDPSADFDVYGDHGSQLINSSSFYDARSHPNDDREDSSSAPSSAGRPRGRKYDPQSVGVTRSVPVNIIRPYIGADASTPSDETPSPTTTSSSGRKRAASSPQSVTANPNEKISIIRVNLDKNRGPGTELRDVLLTIRFAANVRVQGTMRLNNASNSALVTNYCSFKSQTSSIECGFPSIIIDDTRSINITTDLPSYYSSNASLVISVTASNAAEDIEIHHILRLVPGRDPSAPLTPRPTVPGENPDGTVSDPASAPAMRGIFDPTGNGRLHFLIPTMCTYFAVMLLHYLVWLCNDRGNQKKLREKKKVAVDEAEARWVKKYAPRIGRGGTVTQSSSPSSPVAAAAGGSIHIDPDCIVAPEQIESPIITSSDYILQSHILIAWIAPCCYHCGNVHTTITLTSILLAYTACTVALNEFMPGVLENGGTIVQYAGMGFFTAGFTAMFRPIFVFLFSQYQVDYHPKTVEAIVARHEKMPPDLSMRFGEGVLTDFNLVDDHETQNLEMFDVFGVPLDDPGMDDDDDDPNRSTNGGGGDGETIYSRGRHDTYGDVPFANEGDDEKQNDTNQQGQQQQQEQPRQNSSSSTGNNSGGGTVVATGAAAAATTVAFVDEDEICPPYPKFKTLLVSTEHVFAYLFSFLIMAATCIITYLGTYKYTDLELSRYWWAMTATASWTVLVYEFFIVGMAYFYQWMIKDVNEADPIALAKSTEKTAANGLAQQQQQQQQQFVMEWERHPFHGELRPLNGEDEFLIIARWERAQAALGKATTGHGRGQAVEQARKAKPYLMSSQ